MNDSPFVIVSRPTVERQQWDAFVDASDDAWLWHRYDMQDALSTWPSQKDLSFAIINQNVNQEFVVIIPLYLIQQKFGNFLKWNLLNSLGGPAFSNEILLRQRKKIMATAVSHIKKLAEQYSACELTVSMSPVAPVFIGIQCPRVNPLLEYGFENIQSQTWIVDLRKSIEQLWAGMEKRARTAVRKAEKERVTVREATYEDLDLYYDLHCQTYKRTGVSPHPKAYFKAIWENFLVNNLVLILIAEKEGRPVAAENFGIFKRSAVYWTGAANNEGLELQANSLIQWTAMKILKEKQCLYYETGEAFPHIFTGKMRGLNNFKRSFGGELYPLYRGRQILNKKRYILREVWRMVHEF